MLRVESVGKVYITTGVHICALGKPAKEQVELMMLKMQQQELMAQLFFCSIHHMQRSLQDHKHMGSMWS